MTEVLTCLEHQSIPIVRNRSIGDWAITEHQANQISNAKSIPKDAFRWGHKSLNWRQYCGVVQLDGLTLEILPKIHGKEAEPGTSRNALIKMLRKVGLMKVHRGAGASISVQHHSLLDLFILEFCWLVSEQLLLGKPKDYQQQEENLGVIKGKLLINQQLRSNLGHRERLYCQFDELTDDILLNQVIKHTLKLLLAKCRSTSARKAVSGILFQHDSISDPRIEVSDLNNIHLNRSNSRFGPILDWCRLFMSDLNPDAVAGKHELLTILFDMNALFERWVAINLKPLAHQAGLVLKEQKPRKSLAYRHDIDRTVFQMKPDICLLDETGKVVSIFDAKWKLLEPEEAKLGVNQQDMYQVIAYAELYQTSQVGLIYPRFGDITEDFRMTVNSAKATQLTIKTLDISAKMPVKDGFLD